MTTREQRIEIINQIIEKIAKTGRRFFYSKEYRFTAHFFLDGEKNKRLWYRGENGAKINPYPAYTYKDDHFPGGGTLWALVHDFSDFILTGKKTDGNNGYNGLHCSHWGYSEEEMKDIQQLATDLGYL